eukprot:1667662-Prymnesium_polylepis.1
MLASVAAFCSFASALRTLLLSGATYSGTTKSYGDCSELALSRSSSAWRAAMRATFEGAGTVGAGAVRGGATRQSPLWHAPL